MRKIRDKAGFCRKVFGLILKMVAMLAVACVAVVGVYAFQARKKDDLKIWHRVEFENEFTSRHYSDDFTLKEYLEKENALFGELHDKVYRKVPEIDKNQFNRFSLQSPCNPENFDQNYNRSYEMIPEEIVGSILMIHGLTDSPYSMKHLARVFYDNNFYVLVLRMPGHGTAPSAMTSVTHRDWQDAVKVGARHVSTFAGSEKPFYIAGFSNGGLLAVNYSLDSINNRKLPRPDRLFLFSPSIGVSKLAGLSKWLKSLAFIPYFEKSKWTSISPEYDPFKYTSFPFNAAMQLYNLSKETQGALIAHHQKNTIVKMPSIITFQSLVDSTVITEDVVYKLYNNLSPNRHRLILFDENRKAYLKNFLNSKHHALSSDLSKPDVFPYELTLITNKNIDSVEMVAKTKTQGSPDFDVTEDLNLSWPGNLYSLSHIALVFPLDDPLYGLEPADDNSLHLGNIALRGERKLLKIPAEDLIRIRCNPFFDYITDTITDLIPPPE